jgi:hypothetical protein
MHRLGEYEIRIAAENPEIAAILAHYLEYLEGPFPGEAEGCLSFTFAVGEPRVTEESADDRSALGYRFSRRREELLVSHQSASGSALPGEGEARFTIAPHAVDDAELLRDLLSITLAEMLRSRELYPIHAALAEYDGSAALVIGSTGAGKSTLALGMAEAGMGLLTDDWSLLDPQQVAIHGRALVRTASLPVDQIRPGRSYQELERRDDEVLPKVVVTRESLNPPQSLSAPIRLVVLAMREASEVSEMLPARQADALARALGQSPLLTTDRSGFGRQAAVLSRLIETCPPVLFRGGRDVARQPLRGGQMILRALQEAVETS